MDIHFKFIGWCREGTHDKVWGVIFPFDPASVRPDWEGCTHQDCITFWGRRGSKLQTKTVCDDYKLQSLVRSKRNKGYQEVQEDRLTEVYPEFREDLEKTTVWALLTG